MDRVIIVSGGRLGDAEFFRRRVSAVKNRLLVACDGGARHLATLGIGPDVIIGDMDSLSAEALASWERRGVKIVRYPANKDFTDTQLALDYALSCRPGAVEIWGAPGGRIDPTLANIYLLQRAWEAGVQACLIDEFTEVSLAEKETKIAGAAGCLVSIIALSPVVEGISLEGFQYPLDGENLSFAESRGISNIITAPMATIRVNRGSLLIVRYRQAGVFPEAD